MSELDDLNTRLTAALSRIRDGLAALPDPATAIEADVQADAEPAPAPHAPPPDRPAGEAADEIAALRAELETERSASTTLEARVAALKDKIEHGARAEDQKRRRALADLDGAVQALQAENAELRGTIDEIRRACETSTPDAALINRALQAELDALRAARATEAAEIVALLAELKPMLEEAS